MLDLNEIARYMGELKGWALEGSNIVKDYEFLSFKDAINFVNKVGWIAEKHSHHPDIIISHNLVKLSLTTHAVSGLTKPDFDVAKEIDALEKEKTSEN